jgi:hypothetical protein
MKKIITITLFAIAVNFSQAQVTIGKIETHDEKVSSPATEPYDSLSDFTYHPYQTIDVKAKEIQRYIGCQFYLPPIQSKRKDLANIYYTMIGFSSDKWSVLLQNEKRKDSLWVGVRNLEEKFILVPYFVKLQKVYKGKELVCVSSLWGYEPDIITHKTIEYNGGNWICDDVTLLPKLIKKEDSEEANKRDRHYSIKEDSTQYKIYFILKNDKNQTMAIESNNIHFTNKALSRGNYDANTFMTKEVAKKLVEQATEKTQQQNNQDKQQQEKHRQECVKKYGDHYGNLVAQSKVEVGMTTQMCGDALGMPKGIHTSETATGTKGYIVYSLMKVHFENGKVVKIDTHLGSY